jgi:hypothetical protein
MSSPSEFSDTCSRSNQLILDNIPAGILQQLQKLAERNGTSVSHEAGRIVESYVERHTADLGND